MLNTLQLDSAMLNAGAPVPFAATAVTPDAIEFEGYSLQPSDNSIVSTIIDGFSAPKRDVNTFARPRIDGMGLSGAYWRERIVKVSGIMKAATSDALQTAIDALKQALSTPQGQLVVQFGSTEFRTTTATLTNGDAIFSKRQAFHVTFTPFELEFTCIDPMWLDLTYTATEYDSVTLAGNYGISANNLGTYKAQPALILIVESVTTGTAVELVNNTNGDDILVSGLSLNAGDVLIIDSDAKSVTLNGSQIDYSGRFPEIEAGVNNLSIIATAAAIQYTATLKYKNTFI